MPILAGFMVPHPPLIVSEVGKGEERKVQETIDSYKAVAREIADLRPDTVIISSPHCEFHRDCFHISTGEKAKGSFADFGAPQVSFEESYDNRLIGEIQTLAGNYGIPLVTQSERSAFLDHGTMVPLYFIQKEYKDFKLVRIGLSWLSLKAHFRFGQIIKRAVDKCGSNVVYVASGDLSHKLRPYGPYGYAEEGPVYDNKLMSVCSRGALNELVDFDEQLCSNAAECGHRSFVIMSGALDGSKVRSKVYSHEDITGVGYGICSFYPVKDKDPYVKLAEKAVLRYCGYGQIIDVPEDIPSEMKYKQAGVFVSIHKKGELRGCIGTIMPTESCIAKEIISNAISASSRDPRFDPIRPEEIDELEINVDVLSEPELISSKEELDVKRYGVIVSSGMKRGLLLPDLEGVDDVDYQIRIAMSKGNIRQDEPITLHRFEVIRHR